MLAFVIWLFYIRLCAKLGARRIIGGVDGAMYGIFFSYLGILFILASRRMDDENANAILLAKFKQASNT